MSHKTKYALFTFLWAVQLGCKAKSQPECPRSNPYMCGKNKACFGLYEYCIQRSRVPEPCVAIGILVNYTARFDMCQDIITRVKNESNIFTYDESCNLKAACFSEFGDNFTCSAESEPQKNIPEADFFWKRVSVAAFVVIILLIAVIVVLVVIAVYFRRESKKQEEKIAGLEKKMKLRTAGNRLQGFAESNGRPPSIIGQNRIIYDEAAPNSGFTGATECESNGAESVSLLSSFRDEGDGDSSLVSMALTSVTVHNSPPVSTTLLPVFFPNFAQSNESLNDSTASGGSQHNEDSQNTSTPSNEHDNINHHRHSTETDNQSQRSTHTSNEDDNHHERPAETDNHQSQRSTHTSNEHDNNGHPAETDNQNQRSIHMPSTEPSDHQITVVTSKSSVHQPE